MPNRISTSFSQWLNGFNKPIKTAPLGKFELMKAVLDKLERLENRIVELEKPQEVRTHFAGDHDRIALIEKTINSHAECITKLTFRVNRLELKDIETPTRRISSASWKRPRSKDGLFRKGGGHVSA